MSDFEVFTHGQAVAWGIGRAMVLGELLGMTDADYARRVRRLLSLYGYSLDPVEYAEEDLIAAMAQDKKRKGSQIRFILQRNLGQTELLPVDLDLVRRSLVAGREVGI